MFDSAVRRGERELGECNTENHIYIELGSDMVGISRISG